MSVEISLQGKNAVVTGSGKGIGAAIALKLAQAGAGIALVGRTEANLHKTEAEIRKQYPQTEVVCFCVDLSHSEEIPGVVDAIEKAMGHIDILVNNAAVNYRETAFRVELDHWDAVYNTNLKGYFLMARACADKMMKIGGGAIVNIGSELSFVGVDEGQVAYSTSKAAVNQLTRVLGAEWARKNIRVNTVIPCFTETELVTELLKKPGYKEKYTSTIPMGRLATPENVANATLFMVSDLSAFTTGETLLVDGGYTNIRLVD